LKLIGINIVVFILCVILCRTLLCSSQQDLNCNNNSDSFIKVSDTTFSTLPQQNTLLLRITGCFFGQSEITNAELKFKFLKNTHSTFGRFFDKLALVNSKLFVIQSAINNKPPVSIDGFIVLRT
jgi:hypothetical protein